MAAGFPDFGMHDDRGFEPDDVVALLRHAAPPVIFDVAFEFGAQRAVVPETIDAAVDLGGLKDETAALAQRHDLFHERIFFWRSHIVRFNVPGSTFRLNFKPGTLNNKLSRPVFDMDGAMSRKRRVTEPPSRANLTHSA